MKVLQISAGLVLFVPTLVAGFATIKTNTRQPFHLNAKNKSGKGKAKGFAKTVEPAPLPKPASGGQSQVELGQNVAGFSSIEDASEASFSRPEIEVDPNLPTDQRNKEILRQQFGLRSYEEQQGDIKAAQRMAETSKKMAQIKQMKDEEFDIFMVIPPPVIKAVDAFLKIGLTITTAAFVLAGLGITAEAWSVATNNNLPEGIDKFIVNVVEPNFTTGLFVLLGFSISLGVFATAQLGSGSSIYKEEP